LVYWPLMGGLLHLVQRWRAWAGCAAPPSPLIAVPHVAAHPSTASVPTSYYSIWHYNCMCTATLTTQTLPATGRRRPVTARAYRVGYSGRTNLLIYGKLMYLVFAWLLYRTGQGQSPWTTFGPARASRPSTPPARGSSGVASLMRTGTRNRGRNNRKSRMGWSRCFLAVFLFFCN